MQVSAVHERTAGNVIAAGSLDRFPTMTVDRKLKASSTSDTINPAAM